jgi:hypothetical protein
MARCGQRRNRAVIRRAGVNSSRPLNTSGDITVPLVLLVFISVHSWFHIGKALIEALAEPLRFGGVLNNFSG